MRKSLFDIYTSIFKDPDKWQYYDDCKKPNIDIVLNSELSEGFIESYFDNGCKSAIISDLTIKDKMRYNHITSCFLLGIHLKEVFKIENMEPDFKYLWFLTCLFHDFGYDFEKNKKEIPNIDHDLMKNCVIPESLHSIITKKTIENYSKYRNNKDHGIVGGKLLYDRLMKNYQSLKYEKNSGNDDFTVCNGVESLNFKKSDSKYYAEAATAVLLHNIYLCNKIEDKEKYKEFDLDSLIDKKYKFALDASLFFLLLIADTLEPIKKINNFSEGKIKQLIENIFIELKQDAIIISCNSEIDSFNSIEWIKKIEELKSWLDFDFRIDPNDSCKVTITIR